MQGTIRVETKPVSGRAPLGDGDTIEIGQSRYVFKCVSSGNVGQSRFGI
jgi:polyisoprenoid-binding protein YceI